MPQNRRVALALVACALIAGLPPGASAQVPEADPTEIDESVESSQAGKVEIVSERTENAKTFELANGTGLTQIYAEPIHFEDPQGDWEEIDTTLEQHADGTWSNVAGDVQVEFAYSSDAPTLVSLADDGLSAGFAMPAAADVVAEIDGDLAVYDDVLPDVDLELEVTNTGMKEAIVLNDPIAVQDHFEFPLITQGLTSRETTDGTVELVDSSDEVALGLPPVRLTPEL